MVGLVRGFDERDLLRAASAARFGRLELELSRRVEQVRLNLAGLKAITGWDERLAPATPSLGELLRERLTEGDVAALESLLERQLGERPLPVEEAEALLTVSKTE